MTPSEAFLAWIDGRRVQIKRHGEWYDVIEFNLTTCGLFVEATNGTRIRGVARTFPFRLADAPAEPKPPVEGSEAWGLLADLVGAFTGHEHLNQSQVFFLMGARAALKKRGIV